MRLWWYNNVRRHWDNLYVWFYFKVWNRGAMRGRLVPQGGRISRETMEWAVKAARDAGLIGSRASDAKA